MLVLYSVSAHERHESEGEPAGYSAYIFLAWHINCIVQIEITHKVLISCFC